MDVHLSEMLRLCDEAGATSLFERKFAAYMDDHDELKSFQSEFLYPKPPGLSGRSRGLYLCGNSLGIQPKGNF